MKYREIVKAILPYVFTVTSLALSFFNIWWSRRSTAFLIDMHFLDFLGRDVAQFLFMLHYLPIIPIMIIVTHAFLGFLVLLSQLFQLRQSKYQKLIYRLPIVFSLLNLIALIFFISIGFWIAYSFG